MDDMMNLVDLEAGFLEKRFEEESKTSSKQLSPEEEKKKAEAEEALKNWPT